jgi:hypothetical protein
MSNPDKETIKEKALNSTKVGGISALIVAGISAMVPVIQMLSKSKIDVDIIIGMEALAAVLACVAAWIYTIDARIRADLTKTRLGTQHKARTAASQKDSSVYMLAMVDELHNHQVLDDNEFKQAKGKVLNGQAA